MGDTASSFFPQISLDMKTVRKQIYVFYNKSNNTEMYIEKVTTGLTGPTLILGYEALLLGH